MAVKIRLARVGATKQPRYRIVADSTRTKNTGKVLEVLGIYLPLQEKDQLTLNKDRYDYWVKVGALPTRTVSSLRKKVA